MSKLTMLIATLMLAASAQAFAQSAPSDAEVHELVTVCNGIASSSRPEQRSIRACEALATDGRMALVEPSAVIAYQRYREERRQACERRQASPRGVSRRQSC